MSSIPEMDNSDLNSVEAGLALIEYYKIRSRRDLPRYGQRNENSLPPGIKLKGESYQDR